MFVSSNTLPASRSLPEKVLRTPELVAISQICSLALEPAAARVRGSSGDQVVEKTLPWGSSYISPSFSTDIKKSTYNTKIPRCNKTDISFASVLIIHNIPHLDHFVGTPSDEATFNMRVNVERGDCTIVCRDSESRWRRLIETRWKRPSVKVEHGSIFNWDLQGS